MRPFEFFPKNYATSIYRNRTASGGGVLIATQRGIIADEVTLQVSSSGEIVCARISMAKTSPMYICAYYRPPNETSDSIDTLQRALDEINDLTKNNHKSTIVVAGDFNARDIDWDNLTPTQECRKKGLCDKLISILGEGQLHQMQRENTRGDAILDLFCTNKPSLVKSICTIPGLSDHDGIVLADILVKAQINKKPQRRVFVWSKANWDAIKSETIAFSEEFMTSYRDRSVEENWDTLVNHLKSSQEKHIPSKLSSTRYNVPWLTGTIRRMCRKKRRLYRRAKKSGKQEHFTAFKAIQNETETHSDKYTGHTPTAS